VLLVSALLALALAGTAVAALLFHWPWLPRGLRRAAEHVASPGELLWWATLGGAFAGRPTGFSGLVVWILGSATFWFLVLGALIAGTHWLRRKRSA